MSILKLPLWDFYKSFYGDHFDTGMYWGFVLSTLLLIGLLALLIWGIYSFIYEQRDWALSTTQKVSGELIDKKYKGEHSSSGTGTAMVATSNGGVGVGTVSTSSHSPEEFLLFIKADKVYKVEVDMQVFYEKNIGDKIKIEKTIGGLSFKELAVELI